MYNEIMSKDRRHVEKRGGCGMRIRSRFCILCGLILTIRCLGAQSIVISQIYGGGGNSGATLRNDFIELFNRGNTAVSIDEWSIQYASASGTSWDRTLLSGVILPGQYYLVQEAQGNGGTSSLPTPDLSSGINFSATDGKLALVNNSTVLSGAAPSGSSIIDFVGYGSANVSNGSPTGALSNTTAATRQSGGCTDTKNNRSDFSLSSPAPRNSHSQLNPCTPTAPPSKPDLMVTSLTAPTSGVVGRALAGVAAMVKNQGGAATGTFRIGFYFSTGKSVTGSSVYSGAACTVTSLAIGGTYNCGSAISIPSNLSPGSWYLLAFADDQSQVDEADESNNQRAADTGTLGITSGPTGAPQCGIERWAVKTGTDADAGLVNVNAIVPTTISTMTALPVPSNLPENSRVRPTETTVFALSATLTEYKLEDDSDYHLVLQDTTGKTLIAEIPLPGCVGQTSPFFSATSHARAQFNANLNATTSFKTANIPVQITGVGFFDFLHGQTGVAPNGIELHPVLDILLNPTPTITSVNTAGGFQSIAQNDWIEIKGTNLAPSSGLTWSSAPEFSNGKMPVQLGTVSVAVNGKSAYVFYISETQINALTPLDDTQSSVPIVVTNGSNSSAPFSANILPAAPSFLLVGATKYIAATHADGSLLGPSSLSVPGYNFTPAQPGEVVVLYAVGFGLPTTALTAGSSSQSGTLPALPTIQIGGVTATVQFAGVISPGLYQLNVTVPGAAADGDNLVTASYGGSSTPPGSIISVKH
jgi:uncharacterized protein (TIGR03437 family)